MRIFITGAAGRLGSSLLQRLSPDHEVLGVDIITADGLEPLDITDFDATRQTIHKFHPDVVLHPAAWTDVDGCARDPGKAMLINGYGTQHITLASAAVDAAILYISSNEVFDGQQQTPYFEYDTPNPINPYAHSKLAGERAVMSLNPHHYIVRTSWLFAHGGKNFIHAILNAVETGKDLRIVTDEVAHPTYNDDLAEAIVGLIDTGRYGIYHLVNKGVCSRYDFARYFLNQTGHADTPILPITGDQWPRASTPPPYTHLANIAGELVGITLRPWQEAVDTFLANEGLTNPSTQ